MLAVPCRWLRSLTLAAAVTLACLGTARAADDAGASPVSGATLADAGAPLVEAAALETVVDAGPPPALAVAFSAVAPQVSPRLELPPFGIGPQGFYLGSVESGFQLRLRGVIQVDGRAYPGSATLEPDDQFLIRRARPYIEGTVVRVVDFRLLPDFAGGKVTLFEAWVDVHPWRWLSLRAGLMKAPFGLERLQAEQSLLFVERGLPSDLAPDRDIGVDVHGEIDDALVAYDLGVFDGAPDNTVITGDNGAQKDIEARLFIHPFVPTGLRLLRQIGLGVAVTSGDQNGSPTSPWLATYSTPGQLTFFSYLVDPKNIATVVALGERLRYAPQVNAYVGPVGFCAEYVGEEVDVAKTTSTATLSNDAWQAVASVVLTGEAASSTGVLPDRPLGRGGPGAFEVAARAEGLNIDPHTFPTYADPTKSARAVRGVGGVLNWYIDRNTKFAVQYEYSWYEEGAVGGSRPPESSLIARLQAFF